MSRPLKDMITEVLRERYAGVSHGCIVDLTGMSVGATTKFRQELRKRKMRLEVVKNSLARRAFTGGPLGPLAEKCTGPSALVSGGTSAIEVAKALLDLSKDKDFKALKLREGLIEGDRETISVDVLSKMKGRKELLSELAMLIGSPGRRLAGALNSAGGKIAGCLKAMGDKEEKGEAAAAA
jgi:large subunit ribosomal protein L10